MTQHFSRRLAEAAEKMDHGASRCAVQGSALSLATVLREIGGIRSKPFLKSVLQVLQLSDFLFHPLQLLSDVLTKVDGFNEVHLWLLHSLLLIVEVLGARITSEVRIYHLYLLSGSLS